jgi:hypothetical protein
MYCTFCVKIIDRLSALLARQRCFNRIPVFPYRVLSLEKDVREKCTIVPTGAIIMIMIITTTITIMITITTRFQSEA